MDYALMIGNEQAGDVEPWSLTEDLIWCLEALMTGPKTTYISQALPTLQIRITDTIIRQMDSMVRHFEVRGSHPMTLNTQLIGVHPIVFTDADRAAMFSLFHTSEPQVKHLINEIPSINKTFNVHSDPFNILCVWVMHLAFDQIKSPTHRHAFLMNVAKYLHYRFFTSLVNHHLIHGADESVMLAAVASLSRRFDLIEYGSWQKVIEARCEDLISEQSIHYDTFITAQDDAHYLYILSDVQSRIRDKINNICDVYYNFHKNQIKIASVSSTTQDAEGEKILVQRASTFDTMITTLCVDVVNVNAFVDDRSVRAVASQFNAVSPALLKVALTELSQRATLQVASGDFDKITTAHGIQELVGVKALLTNIIQVSFRYCAYNRVSMKSKWAIWTATRNIYSSSQTKDPYVLSIKNSVAQFVNDIGRTSRAATKSSLSLAIIMYVLYRSLKYL